MRADSVGFFWEDLPAEGTRGSYSRVQPPIPDTFWRTPIEFPNLGNAPCIAIDTETYDPELVTGGPGWAKGKGHIVGVSVGTPDGRRWYFPIRHTIEPEYNLDSKRVFQWLNEALSNPHQPKVGANLTYDIGWLRQEGVHVRGRLYDVQYAEALLQERGNNNLELLGEKYCGEGKTSNLLYDWCWRFYGGDKHDQRENIWRAPPRLVGPYAEGDVDLPLRILEKQWPLLEQENLVELFDMECALIYLMIEMRFAGVSVDVGKAEELTGHLDIELTKCQDELDILARSPVNVNASADLARVFDAAGLVYPRTKPTKGNPNGKPSFTKDFLEGTSHPIAKSILNIRRLSKLNGTFIKSYILGKHIDGKVYCQFKQLAMDDGGARSGRFSSSDPNLQNVPARDDELAPLIRGIFIPDYGHKQWRAYDYSQIEYRFLIHFAVGPGSDEARKHFRDHPDTDYHDWAMDLILPNVDWDVSTPEKRKHWRKPVKNINFGMIYGMGIPKLIRSLHLSEAAGKQLHKAYHAAVPFATKTMDHCSDLVRQYGFITTILGRRSRFDLWEPPDKHDPRPPLPYEQACSEYGRVVRAYSYRGLNRRLQGSAADLIKKAMLQCWEDGVFDETGVPRLTVHDELGFSDPGDMDQAFDEMQNIMETAIQLSIPVKVDGSCGPNWGACK